MIEKNLFLYKTSNIFLWLSLTFDDMLTEKTTVLSHVKVERHTLFSQYLEREILFDAYTPVNILQLEQMSLLFINDGQDLVKMPFDEILNSLYQSNNLQPLFCIGLHCGAERKREYGIAYSADYKGYGNKAGLYTKFIFDELLPFVRKTYHIPSFKEKSFAGFSLGALSALDIVWNHASEFSKVGVFSGSLWWRRKGYDEGYNDEMDRLMHLQIRNGTMYPWLKFYLQCGALDESADRNNNGIIDSIDDILDLIVELKAKGYTDEHIEYVLLEDGKHDVPTWQKALPDFLKWGWRK